MFLNGRARLGSEYRDLDKYAFLQQSTVFVGTIEKAVYSDYYKKDNTLGSNISLTLCDDINMQKVGFSIPVFAKNSQNFSGFVSQLMFFAGIDVDNANGLEMHEIKNKNGEVINNKKTKTPLYTVDCFKDVTVTVILTRTGQGQDANGNLVPYFNVHGWHFYSPEGFTANELKYGNTVVDKSTGRGLTFTEEYEKWKAELTGKSQGYGSQAKQQGTAQNQSQMQQAQQGNTQYPSQYSAQPNAQPYRNLPPLPGRPQNMPQQQPTEQQAEQFNQNGQDPLPF